MLRTVSWRLLFFTVPHRRASFHSNASSHSCSTSHCFKQWVWCTIHLLVIEPSIIGHSFTSRLPSRSEAPPIAAQVVSPPSAASTPRSMSCRRRIHQRSMPWILFRIWEFCERIALSLPENRQGAKKHLELHFLAIKEPPAWNNSE